METQTEQGQTLVFNFTAKENARKLLEQEQAFKDLGVEVLE